MKKRLLSVLLVLCMALTLLPFAASAADITASGTYADSFQWTLDSDGVFTISGIGSVPRAESGTPLPWQRYIKNIKTFRIGDGITELGSGISDIEMPNLTAAWIGDSFNDLDNWTFGLRGTENRGLASIEVSADNPNYTSLDGAVYSKDCTQLVLCPKNYPFDDGVYHTPESVTAYGPYSFYGCRNLKSITIPDRITVLTRKVFEDCINLEYVDIGDGIEWIDVYEATFLGCTGIKTIRLGKAFTGSDNWAGEGRFKRELLIEDSHGLAIENIIVDPENPNFTVIDGLLCSKDGKILYCCPAARKGAVTVPDGVETIWTSAFRYCSAVTEVVLPDGLKTIDTSAFNTCRNLQKIDIPDSVTTIGEYAFRRCGMLESAKLPENLETIPAYLFEDCTGLKTVNIPPRITEIGEWAFHNCYLLEGEIRLPDTVKKIEQAAFTSCEHITGINIPDGITEINSYTFSGCKSLEKLVLPDSVTAIDAGALVDCSSLKEIVLPANLEYVSRVGSYVWGEGTVYSDGGGAPFTGCTALERIVIADGNEKFSVVDGVLYSNDRDGNPSKLLQCPASKRGEVAIAESCLEIGESAFAGCEKVTGISIPDNIYSIPEDAFDNLEHLQYFDVSDNNVAYRDIDGVLFSKDASVLIRYPSDREDVSYTVPNSVTRFQHGAFNGSINLVNFTFGTGSETIQHNVLQDCLSIVHVTIPSGVTSIGMGAFMGCTALETVSLPSTVQSIGENYYDGVFEGCTSLREVNIPEGVSIINTSTFRDCSSLKTVTLPSTVSKVESSAFYGCTDLETIAFPEANYTASQLQGDVFNGCRNLRYFVLPECTESISYDAFNGCTSLEKVYIPAGVTSIGNRAFLACDALKDVYFGGTQEQWEQIYVSDRPCPALENANVHFNHTHDVVSSGTLATCTEPGVVSSGCVCGYHQTDAKIVPATGHNWGEWQVTTPATETAEGVETRVCQNDVSHVETRAIPKLAPETCDGGDNCPSRAFTDVDRSAKSWSHEAIDWAVENAITNGVSADKFGPNEACTRAQVVTFLWRAAGEPEPTKTDNPFTDVKADAYYYKAVLWAVEKEITNGTAADKFSPNETCTRGQIVTFLWRAAGEPEAQAASAFTDVAANAYYAPAVNWAVEQGVTNGTSATAFSPNQSCTRAQVVTFLFRGSNP